MSDQQKNEVQPPWAMRNARNIAFTGGLVAIAIGCFVERVSLGFIVPGVLVCGLLVAGQLLRSRTPGEGDSDA